MPAPALASAAGRKRQNLRESDKVFEWEGYKTSLPQRPERKVRGSVRIEYTPTQRRALRSRADAQRRFAVRRFPRRSP